jgi:hypothetical protein
MFVYRPSLPIDYFDGLTPLNEWIAAGHGPQRTAWALRALLVLADSRQEIGWDGDMRHLPMVGCQPVPPDVIPYLVVKQDNNGDTFIITDAAMPHLDEHTTMVEVAPRSIGAWFPTDPDPADEPDFGTPEGQPTIE